MYCKYCGQETIGDKDVCQNCETDRKETSTVQVMEPEQKTEQENTTQQANTQTINTSDIKGKSKIAAGLFGIFFGALGVHNFYLGYTGKAVAQLLITLLTFGILSFVSAIWGLIEGILILTGDIDKDAKGIALRE